MAAGCIVTIPATSANIGSGFDTVGIALKIYNTVIVKEASEGLTIDINDETGRFLPRDERNLVYRAMKTVFDKTGCHFDGLHIELINRIPVTRGLGSSSAGIVGGLLAANAMCGGKLSQKELVTLASKIEGHPDNITPAITGGIAVAVKTDPVSYIKLPTECERLRFALFVPSFILNTVRARGVLPKAVSHTDAVYNTSRSALLTAAFITEQYEFLSTAMQDRLHQPFRKCLIGGVNRIFKFGKEHGAYGTYISGAGPTVISIIDAAIETEFTARANEFLHRHMKNWQLRITEMDSRGAEVRDIRRG